MTVLWFVLAFVGGMAFMWKVGGRLLQHALGRRSLIFEQTLGRLDYERLMGMREAIDREVAKRRPPEVKA